MVTVNIEINTIEEALSLQNVAAIKHNTIMEGSAYSKRSGQVLVGLMWKQVHVAAGKAMEELKGTQENELPFLVEED